LNARGLASDLSKINLGLFRVADGDVMDAVMVSPKPQCFNQALFVLTSHLLALPTITRMDPNVNYND
jgi:hypothetical protein